jgi:membrane protein
MQRHAAAAWSLAKATVRGWMDDFAPSMGAGIAYYTAFSLAPLLIIVIAIGGVVFGEDAARIYVYAQLGDLLGPSGAQVVRQMVDQAGQSQEGIIAPVVSFLLLLLGATTVFAELQGDLDRIWKAPVPVRRGWWGVVRARILSLGLVVSIGFLLLVSLVFSAALAALSKWWSGRFEGIEWLLLALDFMVSLTVISAMFALMYKILPRVRIGWHDVWIGAIVTAMLFTIGKLLVGLYLGKSQVASGFGAAGSLVIVLVWVYYSAQIFLLGAEFTWVYAHRYGSRRGQSPAPTAREALQCDATSRAG